MLKNIMFWFITASAAVRLGCLGYVLWIGSYNLPFTALLISGATSLLMLAFVAKKYLMGCKRKEMELIMTINILAVLFNTMYTGVTCLATLSGAEVLASGTFFDVLAGLTFIFLSRRRTKYVTIAQNTH